MSRDDKYGLFAIIGIIAYCFIAAIYGFNPIKALLFPLTILPVLTGIVLLVCAPFLLMALLSRKN